MTPTLKAKLWAAFYIACSAYGIHTANMEWRLTIIAALVIWFAFIGTAALAEGLDVAGKQSNQKLDNMTAVLKKQTTDMLELAKIVALMPLCQQALEKQQHGEVK